jgi:hypothetical protein
MSTSTRERLMVLPSDQDASGRTLGDEEIDLVTQALRSGILTSTKGRFVKGLEEEAAAALGGAPRRRVQLRHSGGSCGGCRHRPGARRRDCHVADH